MIFDLNDLKYYIATVVTAIIGGVGFLIRKILTSEAKIALLEQVLAEIQNDRKNHDEKVDDMLTELRYDVKSLLQSRPYPRPKHNDDA